MHSAYSVLFSTDIHHFLKQFCSRSRSTLMDDFNDDSEVPVDDEVLFIICRLFFLQC